MNFTWYDHLCEYYNVTPQEALKLGTRSSGRKPSLPGSKTCEPVSGKTFEDIWAEKERKDTKSIYDFYKDQGSWSSFRQCVRHKDQEGLHIDFIKSSLNDNTTKDLHICEYGSGVAPFMTTLMKYVKEESKAKITLVDVDCEHLNFAKYRLNDIKEKRKLNNIDLNFLTVTPDSLPDFEGKKLSIVFCFEVLEHVPSPVNALENITNHMIKGGLYIENFIKHEDDHHDDDGPDLISAKKERSKYYSMLDDKFTLLFPSKEASEKNPNCTRIWQKK
jgi:2-polyprenyl-3-methyl-5-hydroxy-6-metoxy-1,4-benzoquinol methylase